MTKSNNVFKSALIIIILTLGSKFLGFLREVLIAAKFGSGMETDTYFIAMTVTGLMTDLISQAIAATFIPVLSEIESKEGKEGKIFHTNNMVNIVVLLSVILTILGLILAPLLVKLIARGFDGEQYNLAIKLTRIGLPTLLFSGIIGALTGFLHSEQRHISSAAQDLPFNLVYIFFLIFLSSKFGVIGLMVAGIVAVLSQLIIQFPEAKKSGYKYNFVFDLKDKYITKVIYLSIPVLISVAINDLNKIVDRNLASSLAGGSISALKYADRLNQLILGVFISAITTVIFPILAKEANNNNLSGVKNTMKYGVNLIILITIPATVGMVVLSRPIVEIAFQRGEFDSTATIMTSQALIFYSVGLVSMALRLLLDRVYYSLHDTNTPLINGAISVGFHIVLRIIFVQFMDHAGLALTTSIATTIATLLMFYGLKKKMGSLGVISYIKCGLKAGLASAVMGVVAYVVYHGLYGLLGVSKLYNLISLLVAVGLAVIVYIVLCYILGIEEVKDAVDKVKIRLLEG